MSESFKGQMATCGCGAVGGIVEQSPDLELRDPWWVVEHDNGVKHTNVRVSVPDENRFRMVLKEDQ